MAGGQERTDAMVAPAAVRRTSLFKKYFFTIFVAVVAPLLIAGGSETWFGYHDQRARLSQLLDAEARLAAVKIEDFIDGIRDQLAWTVQLPWSENASDRRQEALRLLRQAPAVESLSLVDAAGRERLFVSRIGLNRIDGSDDLSASPAVVGARSDRTWFGPVNFHGGSEPFMTIAVAGNRSAVRVAVAEVNLKFIWDVISAIRVGRRRGVRARPAGSPRRPSRHQPGIAGRRDGAAAAAHLAEVLLARPARRRPAATLATRP